MKGYGRKGSPVMFLLLVWGGWWLADGPDHGRESLFHSEEAATLWVERNLDPDVSYRVVPVAIPDDPGV